MDNNPSNQNSTSGEPVEPVEINEVPMPDCKLECADIILPVIPDAVEIASSQDYYNTSSVSH